MSLQNKTPSPGPLAIFIAVGRNDEAFEAAPGKADAEQLEGIEQGVDRLLRHRLQDDARARSNRGTRQG